MTAYAGADWIENMLRHRRPDVQLSDFGRDVANLLGELYFGIYHLDTKALVKAEWSNALNIDVIIGWRSDWSTYDFDYLTRMVFLAHHMAIRIELIPASPKHMRVRFSRRERKGQIYTRHPRLHEAVASFNLQVSFPEVVAPQPVEAEAGV